MKKKKLSKLSKSRRILYLSIFGLLIIGIGAVASTLLINSNDVAYEPTIVSNYQPEIEESSEELPEDPEETTVTETTPEPAVVEPVSQWPVLLSTSQASSITVVVNKKHKLPESYAPGLRSEASNAISQLYTAATNAGISLKTISSYRSYSTQVNTYNRWVNQSGQAAADTFSARPGHSEHQTGLAIDVGASNGVCDLETCFGNTNEGKWVAANAQNYGFIVRYTSGNDAITGYQYEPWHLRFVGISEAKAIFASGLTMDQYYGIEGGGYY